MDALAVIATVERLELSSKQRLVANRLLQPPGEYVLNAELARIAGCPATSLYTICMVLGVKLMRAGLELRSDRRRGRAIAGPDDPRPVSRRVPRRGDFQIVLEERLAAPSRVPAAYGLCACCGQPLLEGSRDLEAIGAEIYMSEGERRLFDKLTGSFGKWVPLEQLIRALYWDDPDGGPETARNIVSVLLSNLRPRLEANGLAVEGRLGKANGGRRLVWLEPAP